MSCRVLLVLVPGTALFLGVLIIVCDRRVVQILHLIIRIHASVFCGDRMWKMAAADAAAGGAAAIALRSRSSEHEDHEPSGHDQEVAGTEEYSPLDN